MGVFGTYPVTTSSSGLWYEQKGDFRVYGWLFSEHNRKTQKKSGVSYIHLDRLNWIVAQKCYGNDSRTFGRDFE